MAETRDDGVAASNRAQEILVAQRQQVGLDYFKVWVLRGAVREPIRGPHDRPDADVAAQKLLQNTPASAPGAADEKDRVLRVHLTVSNLIQVASSEAVFVEWSGFAAHGAKRSRSPTGCGVVLVCATVMATLPFLWPLSTYRWASAICSNG